MVDTPAKPERKAKASVPATPVVAAPPTPKSVAAKPVAAKPVAGKPTSPTAPVAVVRPEPVIVPSKPTPAAIPAAPAPKDIAMTDTMKTANETAKTMLSDASDQAKGTMEKGAKMFEDMNAFSKGNIEAMVESSKIAAKGAEEIAKYSADYARTAVEKANETARHLAAVKSPTELFKLQSDMAKEAMDSMMAETAKFTENYMKLMGQIVQPISNRFAVAAEKLKIAA